MSKKLNELATQQQITRRSFFKAGTAAVAAGSLVVTGCCPTSKKGMETAVDQVGDVSQVKLTRTLGRTGFQVADVPMGCGRIQEANVVRNAYDRGVNLFDTAEVYGNGDSETKIGEAMQFLDREKIFIVTKLPIEAETTKQDIIDRFGKCLERLQTTYADALYMHGVADVSLVTHADFHAAVEQLKADGKLKHGGISSHGPMGEEPDSMEKVLCAAAEDGRFDVMLLSYNFMNQEEGEKVLACCKANDVGTTGMKMAPGVLEVIEYDETNPHEDYAGYIDRVVEGGGTKEEAVQRILAYIERQRAAIEPTLPFLEKWGIKTQEELDVKSVQWVLRNPDMHTVCVSMPDFDSLDKYLPLSGTTLSSRDEEFLNDYKLAYNKLYCRHGCTGCWSECPHGLSVSTIMRYSYYFSRQGRQKFAMRKYARLGTKNAGHCFDCSAPCLTACPHGIDVQANLLKAHTLLSWA